MKEPESFIPVLRSLKAVQEWCKANPEHFIAKRSLWTLYDGKLEHIIPCEQARIYYGPKYVSCTFGTSAPEQLRFVEQLLGVRITPYKDLLYVTYGHHTRLFSGFRFYITEHGFAPSDNQMQRFRATPKPELAQVKQQLAELAHWHASLRALKGITHNVHNIINVDGIALYDTLKDKHPGCLLYDWAFIEKTILHHAQWYDVRPITSRAKLQTLGWLHDRHTIYTS